jgi:fructose/tagatose bisphosphate aldolase
MPLSSIPKLLAAARAGGYALGYFESWNLESLQGVIDAAERTRSPVIIGFNGDFLTRPGRLATERIKWHAALGRAAAETAHVPCGLIFNECPRDRFVKQAVTAGFNLVMLADPAAPYEDYARRVAGLAKFAHRRGVAVEAEIDELPSGLSGEVVADHSSLTDPQLVARFVAATGIDLRSIRIGNVHVMLHGEQPLDLGRLAQIRQRIDVPLGLHGGTGIPAASLKEAIRLGVVKVAYGTYLKQRYLAALRKALGSSEPNPHELLGMGGPHDVLVAGRLAVREAVLERIDLLGCCGRAR